jgi:carbamoyl-phosphate synthase large subunit
VMEHIEEVGVHSGDSSCVIPPWTLSDEQLDDVEDAARKLAPALGVRGLLNVQMAVKDEKVWILEANPRASRTVPFVSKATGVPLAKVATLVMTGRTLSELREEGLLPREGFRYRTLAHTSVKSPVMPFGRFAGVDSILGPEMRSTGEVMGTSADLGVALAKAFTGAGSDVPTTGTVFISVANRDKRAITGPARRLADLGFRVIATSGTAAALRRAGIKVSSVPKMSEGGRNIVDLIAAGQVDLVVNTPFGREPRGDGYWIRTAASAAGVPCITTMPGVDATVQGIAALRRSRPEPMSLQDLHATFAVTEPVQLVLGDGVDTATGAASRTEAASPQPAGEGAGSP